MQYGGGLFLLTIVLGELYAGAYHVGIPGPLLKASTWAQFSSCKKVGGPHSATGSRENVGGPLAIS